MKSLLLPIVLLLRFVSANEVRSYEVTVEMLQRVDVMSRTEDPLDDPFAEDVEPPDELDFASGVDWLGPVVEKAGFESRFLMEAGELRDCTKRVMEILHDKELKAEAVYDVKGERLIVKGGLGAHRALQMAIAGEMIEQVKSTLSVYELPGVGLQDRSGFWDGVPEEAKLLRQVSWVARSGASVTVGNAKAGIAVESEMQRDAYDGYLDSRLTIQMDFPGGGFSYETGYYEVTDAMWAQEVGSLNGKTTLMLVSHHELVLPNGKRWDDWILKEDGGAFLTEERLNEMRWRDPKLEAAKYDPESETRQWTVPPTFFTFLVQPLNDPKHQHGDPFAGGAPNLQPSLRKLLEENGVVYREGDSVSFLKGSGTLIAKLSPQNLELLDGIVNATRGLGPPEYCYLEFSLIEGEAFWEGRVLKKMTLPLTPGVTAKMTLGEDLAVGVEMQVESDDLMELRMVLTEEKGDLEKASFKTGVAIQIGVPVVVQESVMGDKKRSWVVTARRKILEREIDALLKEREAKR